MSRACNKVRSDNLSKRFGVHWLIRFGFRMLLLVKRLRNFLALPLHRCIKYWLLQSHFIPLSIKKYAIITSNFPYFFFSGCTVFVVVFKQVTFTKPNQSLTEPKAVLALPVPPREQSGLMSRWPYQQPFLQGKSKYTLTIIWWRHGIPVMLSKVMEVFWLQMVIRMWRTSGISESFEKKIQMVLYFYLEGL